MRANETPSNTNIYNPKMFVERTYRLELKGLWQSPTLGKHEETLTGNRSTHGDEWRIFLLR